LNECELYLCLTDVLLSWCDQSFLKLTGALQLTLLNFALSPVCDCSL